MDFAFSDEQQMLRDQARSFLKDRFPEERMAALAECDDGWDPASWEEIVGLGWVGLSTPEGSGGAGMSFLDEAVVLEELGYALYPGPYLSTVALALPALEAAQDEDLLARVLAGKATATLSFDRTRIPDADKADIVFVVDEDKITSYETSSAQLTTLSTMDTSRRLSSLGEGAEGTVVAQGEEGRTLAHSIKLRALASVALEAVGVSQKALDLARSYAAERTQFDKPIGQYQAVSHQITDMYLHTELARSLAYWAAWCVAESDEQADRAVLAAKVQATEAAVFACERSIQVHGGVGFTWEHILHRCYKRAQWLRAFAGTPDLQLETLGRSLFA